jgi:hypothetical protein
MKTETCAQQRLVDGHFDSGLDPSSEHRLREHLLDCVSCRERYQRQLLLARLDPVAPDAQFRLARGLGLPSGTPSMWQWFSMPSFELRRASFAVAGLAALALVLVIAGHGRTNTNALDGYEARGGHAPLPVEVRVYRIQAGTPEPLGDELGAEQELAFAYANRSDKRWMMIFGVDEHRHVYWYFPSWTDPAQDPQSVPAGPSIELKELPEAVTQRLDGNQLHLVGLFSDQPLNVKQVEELVSQSPDGRPVVAGALSWDADFQVRK